MKVIKVVEVAKEPHTGPMFTGSVAMQPIIGTEISKNFQIDRRQRNCGDGKGRNKCCPGGCHLYSGGGETLARGS